MFDALHPALAQARQAEVVRSLPRRRRLAELRARRAGAGRRAPRTDDAPAHRRLRPVGGVPTP